MKIFFSGIAGSGVSAIAGFMADRGNSVAGSDRLFDREPDHPLKNIFVHKGVLVVSQDGNGLDTSVDLAIFSTAVEKDNPDLAAAERFKIPIKTRPEYLAEIVSMFKTVAVAGTSGKSTMSGMLAFVMQRLGMAPNFIGGGRVKQFRTPENQGNGLVGNSDLLVIEACESDGSIVNYRPVHSIIANLDLDHHSVADTASMFEQLAAHTSGLVIVGGDDENLSRCRLGNAVGFSIDRKSEYQATDITYHSLTTSFSVAGQRFELNMPGRHNLYNSLACIA
ncbi:MAG: Mur ligase family protein, partial [Thermodesulfovibrionales bacterium]